MEPQLPKYHETFVPVLQVLNDSGVIHYNELRKKVRDKYYGHLPAELLNQKTKSGDILILNRIGWAKAYLKQGGMVSQPKRAMVAITEKGKQILQRGHLNLEELLGDKEFLANRKVNKDKTIGEVIESESPQDLIDTGIRSIEAQVKSDLLERLKEIDPYIFQTLILRLLEKMGYGSPLETPKSGDGGIDGIINQDRLGFDKIYIQAKRYADNKVRETDIRNFIGAMSRDTNRGVFVTTSVFDEKAIQKAKDAGQKIVMIDGLILADLMYEYDIGVQEKNTYKVKHIDEDFFDDES